MAELSVSLASGLIWLLALGAMALPVGRVLGDRAGPTLLAAYPLFFAFQVLLARSLAGFGLLTRGTLVAVYGLVLAAGAAYWLHARRSSRGRRRVALPADDSGAPKPAAALERTIVLGGITLVLAGLVLFTLVSPVHIWDSLAYHMPMVASYIQNGSLEAWPTQDLRQVYRVNAGELQMLNLALLARSDTWVELPNLLGLVVCLVATWEIARLAGLPERWRYAAVALVLTAPQIVVGAGTSKNDLVFTAALLTAFYWFLRVAGPRSGPEDPGHSAGEGPRALAGELPQRRVRLALVLSAAAAALAAATKVMGLNVIGALGLLGILLMIRGRLPFRDLVLFGGAAAVLLLLLVGDIYLGNAAQGAVPVGIRPGEVWFTTGPRNLVMAARYYLYELSFRRLVIPQVFEHDFLHYGYLFPLMLVGGAVTAFRQLRSPQPVLAALTVTALILFASVIAFRLPIPWDQRFMIWLVPTLAILAVANGRGLDPRIPLVVVTAASTLALGNVTLTLTNEFDALFHRSALHLARTGTPARYLDVPNRRFPAGMEGFGALESAAAPRDSVLYAGMEDGWMYLAWGPRFTRHVEGVSEAEHAVRRLESRDFRFVVIEAQTSEEIRRPLLERAAVYGYAPLVRAEERTILQREPEATMPVSPPR